MFHIDTVDFDKEVYRLLDDYRMSFERNLDIDVEKMITLVTCQAQEAFNRAAIRWADYVKDEANED